MHKFSMLAKFSVWPMQAESAGHTKLAAYFRGVLAQWN